MQPLIDALREQPALGVGILAILLALLCIALLGRLKRLENRLRVAQRAAEDAARDAALAAPGGIDPDVVAELLRCGERPTLEAVREIMRRRAAASILR